MRVNYQWTRNNIDAHNLQLSDLFARIIEYKSNSCDTKFCECTVRIKRGGNMIINATVRNHLYFQQLPNDLFSLRSALWNTTPNAISFYFNQKNEWELKEFLNLLSNFDTSFSEVSYDIFALLTQFSHLDDHQDNTRVTFFSDEVVSKAHVRRQREQGECLPFQNRA